MTGVDRTSRGGDVIRYLAEESGESTNSVVLEARFGQRQRSYESSLEFRHKNSNGIRTVVRGGNVLQECLSQ